MRAASITAATVNTAQRRHKTAYLILNNILHSLLSPQRSLPPHTKWNGSKRLRYAWCFLHFRQISETDTITPEYILFLLENKNEKKSRFLYSIDKNIIQILYIFMIIMPKHFPPCPCWARLFEAPNALCATPSISQYVVMQFAVQHIDVFISFFSFKYILPFILQISVAIDNFITCNYYLSVQYEKISINHLTFDVIWDIITSKARYVFCFAAMRFQNLLKSTCHNHAVNTALTGRIEDVVS